MEVLPAPLGPMIARISPANTSKLTRVRACVPPKRNETSSTLRKGVSIVIESEGTHRHTIHATWLSGIVEPLNI